MKILIDTNIFIPLEAVTKADVEPNKELVDKFFSLCLKNGHCVYLHEESRRDILRDKDTVRQEMRLLAFRKYPLLEGVKINENVMSLLGEADVDSHDFVDNCLLNSLYVNAINILVTNDNGILKKAKHLGIDERVYTLNEVYLLLDPVGQVEARLPQKTELEKCYNIDLKDEIFDSLRKDYTGFDNWFKTKCQLQHRDCFVIRKEHEIAGIAIYKDENACYEMDNKILKICTFKTSEKVAGNKFGELLLKSIFIYCYQGNYDWIYVTAYEHNSVCLFFEKFGFLPYKNRKEDTGEIIYRKQLFTENECQYDPLQFHIVFGPRFVKTRCSSFMVPIKPKYHEILFPELERQGILFPRDDTPSNGILKAYLSRSQITKIQPGDLLYFYRSSDLMAIQARGVVDKVVRTSLVDEILAITGKRTVYSTNEIQDMCEGERDILVILFRQANSLLQSFKLTEIANNAYKVPTPQAIMKLKTEVDEWLKTQKVM